MPPPGGHIVASNTSVVFSPKMLWSWSSAPWLWYSVGLSLHFGNGEFRSCGGCACPHHGFEPYSSRSEYGSGGRFTNCGHRGFKSGKRQPPKSHSRLRMIGSKGAKPV